MPKSKVVEKWEYRVTFIVDAADEDAARDGAIDGAAEEVARDDGEYLTTLEVEEVEE